MKLEDITLDHLLAHVAEDDGHLIWKSHAQAGKRPQWRFDGRTRSVRRVIYELVYGRIKRGRQIGVKCGCELCVHPDHLVARTASEINRGKKLPLSTKFKIARAKQVKSGLLNDEQAHEIRMSDEASGVLAVRHGISPSYVRDIRRGRRRAGIFSPWAALAAKSAA